MNINPLKKYFEYITLYDDIDFLKHLIETKLFDNSQLFKLSLIELSDPKIVSFLNNIFSNSNDSSIRLKIQTILFLASGNVPSISTLSEIVNLQIGFIQIFVLKRSIFLLFNKKIDQVFFNKILEFNWTNLSSLLIISFIKNKPSDKKSTLDNFSLTFNKHLAILTNYEMEEKFEHLFSLDSIVKKCNGRTYYEKTFWKKNNIQRYYIDKNNPSIIETLDIYCEGRFWKNDELYDSESNTPFNANLFWCRGSVCYGINTKEDLNLKYYDWTLIEFSKVLKINLDGLVLSIIGGWVNRMTEIIQKLRCRKCASILRPLPFNPKQLGHYATPLFNCLNENCSEYKKQIRFTHCLNGKCGKLLDNRDLKKCSNGWLICTCGTCCPEHSNRGYNPIYVQ